jgi:hypothetical protein
LRERGPDAAEQWEQTQPKTLAELEQAFFDAGEAMRSKEQEQLQKEHQEKEEQRRKELEMARELAEKERLRAEEADARPQGKEASEQRLRKRAWGLGILMLVALGFMVVATWYQNASVHNEERAKQQLLNANFNLARACEEKALNEIKDIDETGIGGSDAYHRLLLLDLQVPQLPLPEGKEAMRFAGRDQLSKPTPQAAFAQLWSSATLNLASYVSPTPSPLNKPLRSPPPFSTPEH